MLLPALGRAVRQWCRWAKPSIIVGAVFFAGAPGCARVKPWERGSLASSVMTSPFGDFGIAGEYQAKVVESKTGGGVPGSAPGGGCGCTQ